MATKKYNQGGGLNWFWVEEDIKRHQAEQFQNNFDNCMRIINSSNTTNSETSNPGNTITNNYIVMCEKIPIEKELEAKFNFIKNHNGCEEDLEIAKFVVSVS